MGKTEDHCRQGYRARCTRAPRSLVLIWLVALCLLVTQISTAFAGSTVHTAGIDGDRVTVCTGSGLKVFRIDADGTFVPVEEEGRDFAAGLCGPMAIASLTGVAGTDAVLVPWPVPEDEVTAETVPAARPAPENSPPPGRAPPRSV